MKMKSVAALLVGLAIAGCNPAPPAAPESSAAEAVAMGEAALKAYTDAVNSNDVDTLMALTTDDIVLQDAAYPEVVGQAAAREFAAGYFAAMTSVWEKTARDFIVVGDTAYSRYGFRVTNTSKADGSVSTDTGKGLIVYRRGEDGVWRVARDSWSSDVAAPNA